LIEYVERLVVAEPDPVTNEITYTDVVIDGGVAPAEDEA
jgi:hypothetical protein